MSLADKTLNEFLSLGVQGYCQKYHLQCCHMCNDIECGDNTNPLVVENKKLRKSIDDMIRDVKRLGEVPL